MSWIDFILNLAGLLLWLNWRAVHRVALPPPGASLLSTLKRAEPIGSRWLHLAGLGTLLVVRSFFYWQLGSALHWAPGLPLGPVTLAFRSDLFTRMLLFSALSFGATLAVFHLWLLFLSVVNAGMPDANPQQRLLRLQLGWVERWPWFLKLPLPFVAVAALWCAGHPALVASGLTPATPFPQLLAQGCLVGLAFYLVLKYLVAGFFLLYILNTYVYLGDWPIWTFVNGTARALLGPLKRLPLQVGRIDFAPVVGLGLVIGLDFLAESARWGSCPGGFLPALFRRIGF